MSIYLNLTGRAGHGSLLADINLFKEVSMEDMISGPGLNYVAILVGGLAYWALGALWYSPALFGNAWLKAIGKTKEQALKDHTPLNYLWAFITSFIASYGIARILMWSGKTGWTGGLIVGLFCGVCFVMMAFWVNDAFEKRECGLTIMNGLYHVVGLIISGVIIGAWG